MLDIVGNVSEIWFWVFDSQIPEMVLGKQIAMVIVGNAQMRR